MADIDSLARRLSRVSPYAARLEGLIGRVPGLMEGNDQLRPLWQIWCRSAAHSTGPEQCFSKDELRVLRSFFEYLYFASDAFLKPALDKR